MKKILVLLMAVCAIQVSSSACMTSKCAMGDLLDGWKGETLDSVIDVWGYPDKEKIMAKKSLYIWDGGTTRVKYPDGSSSTRVRCTRILEADKTAVIIGASWKGSYCPITKRTAKKWANPNRP